MTRYSIIIPHHGPQQLLDRLLASIPQREDVEVIVVDDTDSRGAGWARNRGMEQAHGHYLIFADDDDYFLPAISDILNRQHTADLVVFSAASDSWRAAHLRWIMAQEPTQREHLLRHTFTEPWCHIVSRELIDRHHLRFDETPILNDVRFSTQAGYHAQTIEVCTTPAYYIDNLPGSTAKRKDPSRLVAYSRVMAETNIFNRQHHVSVYHPRMLRPFVLCLATAQFSTAARCWRAMHAAGFPCTTLLLLLIVYPFHLLQWLHRRRKYSSYASCE